MVFRSMVFRRVSQSNMAAPDAVRAVEKESMEAGQILPESSSVDVKRPQFGTRFLTDPRQVFQHNAWFVKELHSKPDVAADVDIGYHAIYFCYIHLIKIKVVKLTLFTITIVLPNTCLAWCFTNTFMAIFFYSSLLHKQLGCYFPSSPFYQQVITVLNSLQGQCGVDR